MIPQLHTMLSILTSDVYLSFHVCYFPTQMFYPFKWSYINHSDFFLNKCNSRKQKKNVAGSAMQCSWMTAFLDTMQTSTGLIRELYLELSAIWRRMSSSQLSLECCTKGFDLHKTWLYLVPAHASMLNQHCFISTQRLSFCPLSLGRSFLDFLLLEELLLPDFLVYFSLKICMKSSIILMGLQISSNTLCF